MLEFNAVRRASLSKGAEVCSVAEAFGQWYQSADDLEFSAVLDVGVLAASAVSVR